MPTEHGAWAWWLAPLIVGLAASGGVNADQILVGLLALSTFLAHQPATVAVKAWTGRGPRADLHPALGWTAAYGALAALLVVRLLLNGHAIVLLPVGAGLVLFPLHLRLVARRAERRQLAFELIGAAALATWAPAAYLVGGDAGAWRVPASAATLWALSALQSGGAILSVYARLEHRTWKAARPWRVRLATALPAIAVHSLAWAFALLVFAFEIVPFGRLAFVPGWLDAWSLALRPRPRAMPRQIGFGYVGLTAIYVLLMVLQFAFDASAITGSG